LGRIERSIEIRASPEKVWEMLAQDRHLEWFEGYKNVEFTSEVRSPKDKYMIGASAHVISTHDKFDATITESVENEKIVYSIQAKMMRNCIYKYTLKPTEVGTDLTFLMEYEISNSIIRIIDKLMWRSIISNTDKSLEKLKSILEK
jgi:uncharacterized protein YndB with AHSA1/START domain